MNDQPPSDSNWEKLLARARADAGPPADCEALLRAVRAEMSAPPADRAADVRAGWAADFLAVFGSGRVLSGCLAGACALGVIATWQAYETWQVLPWAEWVATTTGGVP